MGSETKNRQKQTTDKSSGFASVHFGGLMENPTDAAALLLAPDLLGRGSG